MKNSLTKFRKNIFLPFTGKTNNPKREEGSALIIALLVMVLLLGFVAFAVSRTTNETIAQSNDVAESRTYEAAQASLEVMTRNFDKIFDVKINPDDDDLTRIQTQKPPDFDANYNFDQTIVRTQKPKQVTETSGNFQGLNASRDEWQINSTATDKTSGAEVALRRRFFNDRIPIFQFGIFYNDDLEFHPGPRFDFGGRVHSNGNLFMMAQDGLYFNSKVSYTGEVFTDVARNGDPWTKWNEKVFIKNASGTDVQLKHDMGSVLASPANGAPVPKTSDQPTAYKNANWAANENLFQGNLLKLSEPLELPLRIASKINKNELDYVELIKRGKNVGDLFNNGTGTVASPKIVPVATDDADGDITSTERYFNKTGIRVSLADSKAKLPGCASGTGQTAITTACGVRLDGAAAPGDGGSDPSGSNPRGYQPLTMTDGYQATELNGERFYQNSPSGRQVWIKIELVGVNPATNTIEAPRDVTQEILSLGVTEPPIYINGKFAVSGYGTSCVNDLTSKETAKDCRSIIKMQRFIFGGSKVTPAETAYISAETFNGTDYNFVEAARRVKSTDPIITVDNGTYGSFNGDNASHRKAATIARTNGSAVERWVVPFPINMFDVREGLYNADLDLSKNYLNNVVPQNGVMSIIDIDVRNFKKFLDGKYNNDFPTGTPFYAKTGHKLRSTGTAATNDVPNANGWVVYISDRRGDYDFDGEYDMEDVFGGNDGTLQPGEDVNDNGKLDYDYNNEAVRYSDTFSPDVAAVLDHKPYRRGVRLINAQTLPGNYDSANPDNTKGFTVASENGVYVFGNYNAYSIDSVGTPTPSTAYNPQDTADHIPASVAADAVTILSNSWSDARSFTNPFSTSKASETFGRFAMLTGDARSSKNASPNQGGGDLRMGGGVHNFKRFLEDWGGVRMNYVGSLINLFNSHNNNGTYKNSSRVYSPPVRNWVFDATFLDPNRLPPGTPFFQQIQLTGFQRLN